jgi:hypothetical protein
VGYTINYKIGVSLAIEILKEEMLCIKMYSIGVIVGAEDEG